ncbi:MAG: hypothetical protein CVU17_08200 [Betaproteobacteria bacterium HGW-Betaproteobacteria-11]|nr:MAG: hypothetical protein CVU17_08200 [Betaproteobacteria bacterium HGW-Betaproteobacteria-11]
MAEPRGRSPASAACPRCGAAFHCGVVDSTTPCWCTALPPVAPPEPQRAGCFCPDCLRQLPGSASPRERRPTQ